MNAGVVEEQRRLHASSSSGSTNSTSKEKKKWGFRRVVSGKDSSSNNGAGAEDDAAEGMRVDFYLVVFLKFIAFLVIQPDILGNAVLALVSHLASQQIYTLTNPGNASALRSCIALGACLASC